MEQLLSVSAGYIGFLVEAMAIVIIGIGSIKTFVAGLAAMLFKSSSHDAIREVWLDYARYLIAGLTFQLAAGHREHGGRADLGRPWQACYDCGNPHVPELFS